MLQKPGKGSAEFWAAERPDQIAIVDGDQHITWRELNDAADRLAEGLSARGLVEGDILVTRMQIRHEWAIASAAAAKLGLQILGLNWRLTPSETQYVLSNSGAHAILCDDVDPAALKPALEGLPIKLAASIDSEADGFEMLGDLMAAPPAESQQGYPRA